MLEEMTQLWLLPEVHYFFLALFIQGSFLFYDEVVLHRQRGLPPWERWGHPMDTFFFALPFVSGGVFITLSVLSCLVILKDEWIHHGRINGTEGFCHGALFVLHPVTLYWGYRNLIASHQMLLQASSILLVTLMLTQLIYWNAIRTPEAR